MSNSMSRSSKAIVFSLLATLSIPSAAMAWDSPYDPDAILTVSVDMDSSNNDDGEGCNGFATMALSSYALDSTIDINRPGVDNPTIQQRLQPFGLTLSELDGNGDPAFFRVNGAGDWMIDRDWANSNRSTTAELIGSVVTNDNLIVDGNTYDASFDITISPSISSIAMVDRKSYVTEPFTLTYDANTCVSDTYTEAEIYVDRSPLQVRQTEGFNTSWTPLENDGPDYSSNNMIELAQQGRFSGYAYLSRTTQIGGETFTREFAEFYDLDELDEIAGGTSGETTLRAVTSLYGDLSVNAQFRTQYAFWMDINLD